MLRIVVGCGLPFACLGWESAPAQSVNSLVTVESGEFPIILSAPHGGRLAIPGVPKRQGTGVKGFRSTSDLDTDELTEKLADALEQKLGKRPYVVIARFHRRYADANRSAAQAYESDAAAATYNQYHQALSDVRDEVIRRWGTGLLLDIHGQAAEPTAILRGTQNGKTTTHLIERFGRSALTGKTSLFGQFAEQGFSVLPRSGSADREHPDYDGGYTVMTYGSRSGKTVDAVQLEFGRELRRSSVSSATADGVATAITAYARDYLPETVASQQIAPANGSEPKMLAGLTNRAQPRKDPVFSDDFSDGNRTGWFEIDAGSSSLSVKSRGGQLPSPPEANFSASDESSRQSLATHFPAVTLKKVGDSVSVQFDARHNNEGFGNRGFRFGLFNSNGTNFRVDGDFGTKSVSLDDDGYFATLDLGASTKFDSAIIRETNNAKDERLWNGATIAFDKKDSAPNPLIFRRGKNYTYTLTLTCNRENKVDVVLKNNVTGDTGALTGTSTVTPTLTVDTLYFGSSDSAADFAIDNVAVFSSSIPATGSPHERGVSGAADNILVGVYVDEGAGPSVNDLLFVLGKFDSVTIRRLKAEDMRPDALSKLDVLIHPGGSGGGQGRHLGEERREAIRDYVDDGGGFVGICAGAYLATAHYTWSLNILDAKVVDSKHWNRGTGTVDIGISDAGGKLLNANAKRLAIFYGQGPLLAPGDHPDIDDYEVMATFATEIAENGAIKGVMPGTTAIARGRYGAGRVMCFSPHPEMTNGLESMIRSAIDHVKRARSQ